MWALLIMFRIFIPLEGCMVPPDAPRKPPTLSFGTLVALFCFYGIGIKFCFNCLKKEERKMISMCMIFLGRFT